MQAGGQGRERLRLFLTLLPLSRACAMVRRTGRRGEATACASWRRRRRDHRSRRDGMARRGRGATPCVSVRTAACGGPRLGLRAVARPDFTCGPRAV